MAYSTVLRLRALAEDAEERWLGHTRDRTRAAPRRCRGRQPRPDQHRHDGVPGGAPEGREKMERSLELAEQAGSKSTSGMPTNALPGLPFSHRSYALADRYIEAGLEHCSEHGFDLARLYLLDYRARAELDQGRWREAVGSAALVLQERCISTTPRILALVMLGLVRARRGDPGTGRRSTRRSRWRSRPESFRGSRRWQPREPRLPGSKGSTRSSQRRRRLPSTSPCGGGPRGRSASSPTGAGAPGSGRRFHRARRNRTPCRCGRVGAGRRALD